MCRLLGRIIKHDETRSLYKREIVLQIVTVLEEAAN